MGIEILVIGLAVVLFGGMFLGLLLSYRDQESRRTRPAAGAEAVKSGDFYGLHVRDAALAEELMLRQIEHHLRREALLAEQFILDPSPRTLRAGSHPRMEAC